MENTKHTPEEWRIETTEDEPNGHIRIVDVQDVSIALCYNQPAEEHVEANANLIVAAPELLEACEGALLAINEALENKSLSGLNIKLAPEYLNRAIKKAKGA